MLSPFLHKDLSHIVSNSVPLFALLALLAGSRADSRKAVLSIIVTSGGLLWLFGRSVPVVGASGLVFGLIVFLILSGIRERRGVATGVSLLVGLSYGSTLLAGIMPGQTGISWDGHLAGAVAGGICAWLFTLR
jgi:membrane associated rhomboid family serine protease